jgi:hypothetical protein
MYTIRLNPDAGTGSGGGSSSVSVPVSDYEALLAAKAELATLRTEQEGKLREAETERLKAITDKDELAKELDKQRGTWEARESEAKRKAAEIESNWHKAEKARALTSALSGFDFVDDKARQHIAAILDAKFEAKAGADGVGVFEAGTGRGIADAVKELLPSEFAYALKPTTTGGSGATQTRQGNGAAGLAGQFVVDRQKLNDPAYMQANQGKIAEAAQAGTLAWN